MDRGAEEGMIEYQTALEAAKRVRTLREMLADTADLLEILRYSGREDERAAKAQVEAIREVLTDSEKAG